MRQNSISFQILLWSTSKYKGTNEINNLPLDLNPYCSLAMLLILYGFPEKKLKSA